MSESITVGGAVTVNPLIQQQETGYVVGGFGNPQIQNNRNNSFQAGSSNGYFHNLLNSTHMPTRRG